MKGVFPGFYGFSKQKQSACGGPFRKPAKCPLGLFSFPQGFN
jgi:hypothetical protein